MKALISERRGVAPVVPAVVAASLVLALTVPPAHAQHPEPPVGGTISQAVVVASVDSAIALLRASYATRSRDVASWDSLNATVRERAHGIRTIGALRELLDTLIAHADESHFSLVPQEAAIHVRDAADASSSPAGPPGDAGFDVRLRDQGFVVIRVESDGPADRAGIRTGWLVESIDQVDARALHADVLAIADSTVRRRAIVDATMLVVRAARGAAGETVMVEFGDAYDRMRSFRLTLRETPGEVVAFGNLPPTLQRFDARRIDSGETCVGVVRFNAWLPPLAKSLGAAMDSLSTCRGIVLDLRGNTGGVAAMIIGVAGYFFDEARLLGTLRTRKGELRFTANPRRANDRGEPISPHQGPLALLVDDLSVSTTELFAAAMQSSGRARVFGERTAGQAQPSMLTRLPSGDLLLHVVADFVAPDGRLIEGRGVTPDVVVPWSRSALLGGRDAALSAALDWIAGQALTSRTRD